MTESFVEQLKRHRQRLQRSRNMLAEQVGVNPSYLTRIENGHREAPRRSIVMALARQLRLTSFETNCFMVAAGYTPPSIGEMDGWDPVLQEVTDILRDPLLSEGDRTEFSRTISTIARHWRESVPGVVG